MLSKPAVWTRLGEALLVVAAIVIDLLVWGGDSQLRSGGTLPDWAIPLGTACVYSLLLLRWRFPLTVFLILLAFGFIGLIVPGYEPFFGLLIALHAVGRKTSTVWSVIALIASTIPFGINAFNTADQAANPTAVDVVATSTIWAAIAVAVWSWGRLAHESENRAHRRQQEALRAQRLDLARDLHDSVASSIGGVLMFVQVGQQDGIDLSPRVREALKGVELSGQLAAAELTRLLVLLRSMQPGSEPLTEVEPSLKTLDQLLIVYRMAGLGIEITERGNKYNLEPNVELVTYRIIQEALTNARKHGGLGASVLVNFEWSPTHLVITISSQSGPVWTKLDDSPIASTGLGLLGLKERVGMIGGNLTYGPTETGFLIEAAIPIGPLQKDPPLRSMAVIQAGQ